MGNHLNQDIAAAKLIARNEGATIRQIQENLGISRRTAFRVLQRLEEQNYPLYSDTATGSRETVYKMNRETGRTWNVPLADILLTQENRTFLEYLLHQATAIPALRSQADEVIRKLQSLAAEGGAAFPSLHSSAGNISLDKPSLVQVQDIPKLATKQDDEHLRLLLHAISNKNVCTVQYRAANNDQIKRYNIFPLICFIHHGGVYAYAYSTYYGTLLTLALERIQEIGIQQGLEYTSVQDIDPRTLLEDPFGITLSNEEFTAVIRLTQNQGWYEIQKAWPDSVNIELQPDGSYLFTVTTRGHWELWRWILSMGNSATVLEPKWLRDDVIQCLQDTIATYSTVSNT